MAAPVIRFRSSDREVLRSLNRMEHGFGQLESQGVSALRRVDQQSRTAEKGLNALAIAAVAAGAALTAAAKRGISEWRDFEIQLRRTQNIVSDMTDAARDDLGRFARSVAVETGASLREVTGSTFTAMSGGARGQTLRDVVRYGAQTNIAYGLDATMAAGRIMQGVTQTGLAPLAWLDAAVAGADIGQTDFRKLSKEAAKTTTGARLLGIDQRENLGLLGYSTLFAGETSEAATQLRALYAQATKEDSPFAKEFRKTTGNAFLDAVSSRGFIGALSDAFQELGPVAAQSRLGTEAGLLASNLVDNQSAALAAMNLARTSSGSFQQDYRNASNTLFGQSRRVGATATDLGVSFGESIAPGLESVLDRVDDILSNPDIERAIAGLGESMGKFLEPASQLAGALASVVGPMAALASVQIPSPGGGVSGMDIGGTAMGLFGLMEMRNMLAARSGGGVMDAARGMGAGVSRSLRLVVRDKRGPGGRAVYGHREMTPGAMAHKAAYAPLASYPAAMRTAMMRQEAETAAAARGQKVKAEKLKRIVAAPEVPRYGMPWGGQVATYSAMLGQPPAPWHAKMRAGMSAGLAGFGGVLRAGGSALLSGGMYGMMGMMLSDLFGQITGFDPLESALGKVTEQLDKLKDSAYHTKQALDSMQKKISENEAKVARLLQGESVTSEDQFVIAANSIVRSIFGGVDLASDPIVNLRHAHKGGVSTDRMSSVEELLDWISGSGGEKRNRTLLAEGLARGLWFNELAGQSEDWTDLIADAKAVNAAAADEEIYASQKTQFGMRYPWMDSQDMRLMLGYADSLANIDIGNRTDAAQLMEYVLSDLSKRLQLLFPDAGTEIGVLDGWRNRVERSLQNIDRSTADSAAAVSAEHTTIYHSVGYMERTPLYQIDEGN